MPIGIDNVDYAGAWSTLRSTLAIQRVTEREAQKLLSTANYKHNTATKQPTGASNFQFIPESSFYIRRRPGTAVYVYLEPSLVPAYRMDMGPAQIRDVPYRRKIRRELNLVDCSQKVTAKILADFNLADGRAQSSHAPPTRTIFCTQWPLLVGGVVCHAASSFQFIDRLWSQYWKWTAVSEGIVFIEASGLLS